MAYTPTGRPRGRPKGSKNKVKEDEGSEVQAVSVDATSPDSSGSLDSTSAPKRRYTKRRKIAEPENKSVEGLHELVMIVLSVPLVFVPQRYMPTRSELDDILTPWERIYLRHNPQIPEVNPDYVDAGHSLVSIISYFSRIRTGAPIAPNRPVHAYPSSNNGATETVRVEGETIPDPIADIFAELHARSYQEQSETNA